MASMNEKDYYALLGVEHDATKDQIRRAFQRKAAKLHPDVNKAPDAEERFKEISEAYAVLSDETKRSRYDAMRSGNPFAAAATGNPSQGSYGSSPYGAGPFGGSPFGWGFPFDMGTTSRRSSRSRAYRPRAGADVSVQIDIDDTEARDGIKRGLTYQHYVSCDACHGKGSVESAHATTCPTCGGSGHIGVDLGGIFGMGVLEMDCPECEGTGQVVADPCEVCGGSGRVLSASEVVIDIPAGSHDGDVIRIQGKGNAGTNGEAPGDFVCRIGVPSERLSAREAMGMQILGFDIPFIILGILTQALLAYTPMIVTLLLMACIMSFSGGIKHTRGWWRSASRALANGVSTGLVFALVVFMTFSCSASLGRSGYMG